jgi:hypothetical protein
MVGVDSRNDPQHAGSEELRKHFFYCANVDVANATGVRFSRMPGTFSRLINDDELCPGAVPDMVRCR